MPVAIQLALMVIPLSLYLYVLGIWHSGRTPRVVAGPVDLGLLAFGLSGLLIFGPIGRLWPWHARGLPGVWAWLALTAFVVLLALPWLPRSFRRLAVYNVDPET